MPLTATESGPAQVKQSAKVLPDVTARCRVKVLAHVKGSRNAKALAAAKETASVRELAIMRMMGSAPEPVGVKLRCTAKAFFLVTVLGNVKPSSVAPAMVKDAVTDMANARVKGLVGDLLSAPACQSSFSAASVRSMFVFTVSAM